MASGLNRRVAVVEAAVTTEQTARADADMELDGRLDVLEADPATGTALAAEIVRAEAAEALKQDAATAATDAELATAVALLLPKAGGTMTGALTLAGDPTNALHAASRQYVLAQIAAAIDALVAGAPGALDTLKELADQLANDESAAAALASLVAGLQTSKQDAATAATDAELASAVSTLNTALGLKLDANKLGAANGAAQLDGTGKLPNSTLHDPVISTTQVGAGSETATVGRTSTVAAPALRDFVSVKDAPFNAKGDMKLVTDGAMTAGQPTLTSATAQFVPSDVGKICTVVGASAVTAGARFVVTITGYISATQVTLSSNAGLTVSGAQVGWGTNDFAAIQAAWDAVATNGGRVYMPEGAYAMSPPAGAPAALNPAAANVSYVGAGTAKTTLYMMGGVHCISRVGSLGAPLTDLTFQDFGIDGTFQYGVAPYFVKAVYCAYMLRPKFLRLWVRNAPASGLGCDFMQDYEFDTCLCESNGRLGTSASPGCAGIGIGTGQYATENGSIRDCICRGNMTYGLFFENQTTGTYSAGQQVRGGRYESNWRGIGDCGNKGMIVSGADIVSNTNVGFYVGHTSIAANPGYQGKISDCNVTGNASQGVVLDYSSGTIQGQYAVTDNLVRSNGAAGVKVANGAGVTAQRLIIEGNACENNQLSGILLSAGTITDSDVLDNRCFSNGQSSSETYGIEVAACALTRCRVDRNTCQENGLGTASKQTHGIFLDGSSTLTTTEIKSNRLRNNLTAGMSDGSTKSGVCPISDNDAFNPVGLANVTITASPMTLTAGQQRTDFYVIGGTVNPIQINGSTIYNAGAVSGTFVFSIEPGDTATVTYSVAPTAIKSYKH